jgi:phage pi2 protein 07
LSPPKDPLKYTEFCNRARERTIKQFQNPVTRKNHSDAQKKRWEDPKARKEVGERFKIINGTPEARKTSSERLIKRFSDLKEREKQSIRIISYFANPLSRQNCSESQKKRFENPEEREKHKLRMKEVHNRPDVKERMNISTRGVWENPEKRKHHGEIIKKALEDPEKRQNIKNAQKELWTQQDHREKHRNAMEKIYNNPEIRAKQIEARIGGFWYGNVKYPEGKIYCEKWTPNLRKRIRAFWNNESVISRKTKSDNGNRELSCHHVYYQPKACCVWDEDAQGYYAIIDGERYYIKGDPNKFVILTSSENTSVECDKFKWIKFFEEIIETQNGKCYYTKKEWKEEWKNCEKRTKIL